MVWRDTFPPVNELTLDAEAERERRLAAQARAGADWALTALIARYQPTVTRYLTRLCGDQGRARELAERVFQRMERRLHGPHGAENLRLWLLRSSTEAGLEALRRPQRAQAPRLGATQVAGLLSAESSSGSESVLRGGISRLRNVVGAVSRQARPLVWQETSATSHAPIAGPGEQSREAVELGPVDESLDTIDPREALRHRLIRMTLADLPYGDAQCLALHLVAGLNQAEVARALGITSSAARKRIVQGLSQFSERYQAAVLSLGLPQELGYGDSLPKRFEEAAPAAEPEPEPVIVSASPEDMVTGLGEPAPSTIPLSVDTFDDGGETLNGVTYYAGSPSEELPVYHIPVEPDYDTSAYEPEYESRFESPFVGFAPDPSAMSSAYTASYASAPRVAVLVDEPEMMRDVQEVEEADPDEIDAPYVGVGSVTRIAADAIVGPVVDALPVHSEPLAMAPGFGSPSPRSTPLAYELASGGVESGSITMNWIDSTGMMAPLSFETIVASSSVAVEPEGSDDPWARSAILALETPVEPDPVSAQVEASEEAVSPAEIAEETPDASVSLLDLSIALHEGDYGWERSNHGAEAPEAFFDEPAFDDSPEHAEPDARRARPVTRTLEDLWDETPDTGER